LHPAVPPTSFSREANRAGRRFEKPAPQGTASSRHRVSEVRTKPTRLIRTRKLGSCPRLCWPHFRLPDLADARCEPGLSFGLATSAPAVSDRSIRPFPARPCAPCKTTPASFPFRCPAGMPKRNRFRSPLVFRDAQRRADKLGRHARCRLSRLLRPSCQALSAEILAKMAVRRTPQLAAPPNRLGISTFTPGPMVEETATRLM
jgi:hypothetical protein